MSVSASVTGPSTFYTLHSVLSQGSPRSHRNLPLCTLYFMLSQDAPRSYRDLPIRWAEMGTVYRYERSGTLNGLFRVRGFTQVRSMPYQVQVCEARLAAAAATEASSVTSSESSSIFPAAEGTSARSSLRQASPLAALRAPSSSWRRSQR